MKYISDHDGKIFSNPEDCLRHEGECQKRDNGAGCMIPLAMLLLAAIYLMTQLPY